MKKLLIALVAGITSYGYSQCITGNQTVNLNQAVTFTSVGVAQCASCYDWDINGNTTSSDNQTVGTVQIVGSDQGQSVSILGVTPGPFTLNVTYLNENGCQSCTTSFSGTVVDPSCAFTLSNITTTVGTGSVTFQTTPTPSITSGITYTWTATYQDGSTSVIVVNNSGTVTFPATGANPLASVCVTANYLSCTATKCLTTLPCALPSRYNFLVNKFSASGGPVWLIPVASWNSNYTYTWVSTYADGSTYTSYGTTPATNQFPGCNNGSNLVSTTLTLCSPACCKTYTVMNEINWCSAGGGTLRTTLQNPVKNRLNLETVHLEEFTGVIYDLNGNKLMEFNQNNLPSLDISKLEKKLHIIKISNKKGENVYSEKIMIE